jgi:hypothetical protein
MSDSIASPVASKFFSISFDVKAFKKAFDLATKFAPRRSPKPVLTQVKLTSLMLDPVAVKGFLKNVGLDRARIDLMHGEAKIRTDYARTQLEVKHDPEVFPASPRWDDTASCWSIPVEEVVYIHDLTTYATDADSTRFALGSVLMEFAMDGTGIAVATDGRRLVRYTFDCERQSRGSDVRSSFLLTVPAIKLLRDVVKMTGEPVLLQNGPDPKSVVFRSGDVVIHSREMEGRFPRYQDVIPDNSDVDATIDPGALLEVATQAAATNIEDVKVRHTTVDGQFAMDVLLTPAMGVKQSGIVVETERNGAIAYSRWVENDARGCGPRFARLDSRYVVDLLKSMGKRSGEVVIRIIDDRNPVVFRSFSGRLVSVIMPMSIEDKGRSRTDRLGTHGKAMIARLEGCKVEEVVIPADVVEEVTPPSPDFPETPAKQKRVRKPRAKKAAPVVQEPAIEATPTETPSAPNGWTEIEADDPTEAQQGDPAFRELAPISGGSPSATDSALEGRARLARIEPDDDDEQSRVPTLPVDHTDPWLDRFARLYAPIVLECVMRARDKTRRDSPLSPWVATGEGGREYFVRWFDRIGFEVETDCEYTRFDRFLTACLEGSPVSFPEPPGGPQDASGGRDVESTEPTLANAASEARDVSTLVILVHGIGMPVIQHDTTQASQLSWSPPPCPVAPPVPDFPGRGGLRASLQIEIAGTPYGLIVLPGGFDLCKPSGQSYLVTTGPLGPSCECPDFRFRHSDMNTEGCRHVKALREVGLIPSHSPASRSPAAGHVEPCPECEGTGLVFGPACPVSDAVATAARFFGML